MTRVVRFHKTGAPEVLQIDNIELPAPEKNEILIKVKAIGLNRAEAMFRAGKYLIKPELPSKLGYEASGIVESVGPGINNLNPGDIVSVIPFPGHGKYGVYGEEALVPADYVVKHPSTLNFNEASAIWMQYLTAYGALIEYAKMEKGDFVVIPAASSSVGLAAIQLANLLGAIPIAATRTSKKKAALEKAGAKHVIVTEEENIAERLQHITKGKGARIVFDPVGGKTVLELAKGMANYGILIEYGVLASDPTPFPLITALEKGLTMRGYVLFELLSQRQAREKAVKFILSELKNGHLKPLIAKTFKFEDIVEAHRFLESNQQLGKIVVTV